MTAVKKNARTETSDVAPRAIPKARTGIAGLDEITGGGLPAGRPTLVTGAAGCGKTLLGIEFLVHGALDYGERGVLIAFEESAEELTANVKSLGFDLDRLQADGLLVIDTFHFDPGQIVETGTYDLEGLFIRLASAIDSIGAKRVLFDTVEVLFGALQDQATVRAELSRLFRWLKQRGLTTVVTGEPGVDGLTRHGIEEYVSDCVIALDHRVSEELSTRRLRVVKYRGSLHGTNEYPFLITDNGLAVLPLSALRLDYAAPDERVSTGIPRLDHMLGGGLYRNATVLVSGSAGTGKTTLAAKFVEAGCRRGERALFVSFEESPAQLVRDMRSVNIDLQPWLDNGQLHIWSGRPSSYGLEAHLAALLHLMEQFGPTLVVMDPMTALERVGAPGQVTSVITREIDLLRSRGVTTVATSLTHSDPEHAMETSALSVTSLVDTWLLLRNVETNGERNRLLFVPKSRGSAHSNQVREFVISNDGPDLLDVYIGLEGVLTGSARMAQQAREKRGEVARKADLDRRRATLAQHAASVEAQISALRASLEDESEEVRRLAEAEDEQQAQDRTALAAMAEHRWADTAEPTTGK